MRTIKLYNHNDFSKADRLSRIQMHIMEPERFHLYEHESIYYQQLLQAYHGTYDKFSRTEAVKFIQETIPNCETWYKANRVFQDCCELFGYFIERNNKLQRMKVVEKLYYLAEKLESEGKYLEASTVIEKAAKIEGLDKPDEMAISKEDIFLPPITISNDPKLLIRQKSEEEG